ncbi:hypothetical protein GCM10009665_49610 [Kitasatospora nipponensis]|uniref:Secreted protein n=1 Tax=Kitasatospora nipponensis TaxID=258049 RepID=A0ABN1WNT9_9ACTN
MNKRITLMAAAALAVVATLGTSATAATAAPSGTGSGAVDRNVRRTPAVTPRALTLSPGCSGTTLPIDCTITEPVVTTLQTTYNFSFLPGDHVTVNAGGCVQTGGHGLTWKRYVDPASDSDLYHGLITIPGATANLARLVDVVGRQYVVGGRGGSLILGYQDNGYDDNGYYAHDNGTADQCLNSVNAFVHIVIS